MSNVKELISKVLVSSVLNRNAKQFGKNYIVDGNPESCWSSSEGSPQWVKIEFNQDVTIEGIEVQFQGGFAGKECSVKMDEDEQPFYPEDSNVIQKFMLSKAVLGKLLLIMFNSSTDFFGRIVLYDLRLHLNTLNT